MPPFVPCRRLCRMSIPFDPDEAERLSVLESYDLLDTPADEAFDRITRLASHILEMPIALVSLVDGERQWFKSRQGLDAQETPREMAFCQHAILGDQVMVVPDATCDDRFSDNPLVTGAPDIRFYAGAPLIAPCGSKLGTLCVIDRTPRDIDDRQRQVLKDLAAIVIDEIELRRLASTDPLTGAFNRRHVLELAEREFRRARRYQFAVSLAMIDIDEFKAVNDRFGHAVGDAALRALTECCSGMIREQDVLGRLGGEEFLLVLPHTDSDGAGVLLERLREAIAAIEVPVGDATLAFTVSIGQCEILPDDESLESAIGRADAALFASKRAGRNRVTLQQAA